MKKIKNLLGITLLLFTGSVFAQNIEYIPVQGEPNLPFSDAVEVNNTLYLSGDIAFDTTIGKVTSGGIKNETDMILMNLKKRLTKLNYSMKNVVQCTVILKDIKDFKQFNNAYISHFEKPYPARTTFAAKDLILNANIEIACIAAK